MAQRRADWFFVVAFSFFAFTSFFSDAYHALGWLDETTLMGRANLSYAAAAGDTYLLADHPYARLNTAISAFVYGPFYLLLVYAFIKGKNWIRIPAFVYVGAMLHGWSEFMFWELGLDQPPRVLPAFFAAYLPYGIVPLLLAWRVRKPAPFGTQVS